MKREFLLLLPVAVCVLLSGCGRPSNESAQLEALTKKVDALAQQQSQVVSNQMLLFREVLSVKSSATSLPTAQGFADAMNFYQTNSFAGLDRLGGQLRMQQEAADTTFRILDAKLDTLETYSNRIETVAGQVDTIAAQMVYVDTKTEAMDFNVVQLKDDIAKIKARLGINY